MTKRGYIFIFLGIVLILYSISNCIAHKITKVDDKPLKNMPATIISPHRGGLGLYPENTLHAFRTTYATYPDSLLEMDLRTTKDNILVLSHDDNLSATTGQDVLISESTYSQLLELDTGFMFSNDTSSDFPFRGKGLTITRFEDILNVLPEALFSIEIKEENFNQFEDLFNLIDSYNAADRIILSSFYQKPMDTIRTMRPELATGFSEKELTRMIAYTYFCVLGFVPAPAEYAFLPLYTDYENNKGLYLARKFVIRRLHRKGIKVLYWTVNDKETAGLLLKKGADGIVTDRPDIVYPVIKD